MGPGRLSGSGPGLFAPETGDAPGGRGAIATVTGGSQMQVRRDAVQVPTRLSPGQTVSGRDGKRYRRAGALDDATP